jgi:hypothetical protein
MPQFEDCFVAECLILTVQATILIGFEAPAADKALPQGAGKNCT